MLTSSVVAAGAQPSDCQCQKTAGFVRHWDHGSHYVSIVYNERLAVHRITASTGTVGDSYDNVVAKNANRSYDSELTDT